MCLCTKKHYGQMSQFIPILLRPFMGLVQIFIGHFFLFHKGFTFVFLCGIVGAIFRKEERK